MSDSDSPSECDFGKSYGSDNILPYDILLSSLLKDSFLCDVTICVHLQTVPVHRVILSAASCYFHDLFKHSKPVNQLYDLTELFIDPEKLDQIITYIYKGIVNIDDTNVVPLLAINKVLGITSLDNHCAQFFLSKMRPENVLEIWHTAWKFDLQELANVSRVVYRETVCDSMLIIYDVIELSEEFISLVLATEEVLSSISPNCVVHIISRWLTAHVADYTERAEKFLSLLDIYLDWKSLSKTEFKNVWKLIRGYLEFDPLKTDRLMSWQLTNFTANHDSDEDSTACILDNLRSSDFQQDWSLLVAEKDIWQFGIYCNTKSKWFTMHLLDDPLKVIGLYNDYLVLKTNSNDLLLKNVARMAWQTVPSRYKNYDYGHTFFMHANNIYSVDAVKRTVGNDLVCIINRWDRERNHWVTILHINPELSNIISVSLTVETYYGDDVYLFLTVRRERKQRKNTNKSAPSTGKRVTSFGEERFAVYQKLLETFYVFSISMMDFTYCLIGKRLNGPANLNTRRKIILQDKIIFLLDSDGDIERKFGYAYQYRKECSLSCLGLFLDGENNWMTLFLRVPFPDVSDISIRNQNRASLDCSVTSCKNQLFVGIQWCPFVFQVFMYDISTLIVRSLPPIPLLAIRRMSLCALFTSKPISDIFVSQMIFRDSMHLHFKNWSLLSWDGTLIQTENKQETTERRLYRLTSF